MASPTLVKAVCSASGIVELTSSTYFLNSDTPFSSTADKASTNGVEVGEWYTWMVSPFGDDLSFTSFEETQRNKYINAKPTEMSNDPLGIDKQEDSIDSEELLKDL